MLEGSRCGRISAHRSDATFEAIRFILENASAHRDGGANVADVMQVDPSDIAPFRPAASMRAMSTPTDAAALHQRTDRLDEHGARERLGEQRVGAELAGRRRP
jgi:hypothetical protein